MKTSAGIVAVLILLSCGASFGAEPSAPPSNSVQSACAALATVRCFAFGGVGYTGAISAGEEAYRAVLGSTNALGLFETILSRGTSEAKLYALCGIRRLHPEAFAAAAKDLRTTDPQVNTMSGCLLTEEPASAVIRRIANGDYDDRGQR